MTIMNNKFYSLREKIFLLLLLLTSVGSLIFFFQFKTFAFPEYNIQFLTNRTEATQKADQLLSDMGINTSNHQAVTVFNVDEEAKTYLERTGDVSKTATLAEDTVDLWHFTTRVFKPLEKEEYSVSFLPSGRFSGFSRVVAEDKPGASLSQTDAMILAEKFRYEKAHIIGSEWELVDVNRISRKNRVDYKFVWEKNNFTLGDATYRQEVGVMGNEIGWYSEYLNIPEAWQRQYENERSQNDLAQIVAEVLTFVLFGISAIVFFIFQYKNNKLRLRLGSYVATVTFIIVALASLNSLPLTIFTYDTTESWGAFIGQVILASFFAGGMLSFINFFIVVVGESLYRQLRPQQIAIEQIFRKGLLTKSVNKSLLVGSFAGIVSFGYVVLFYITGRTVGFWSPAEINYNDAFSTYIPWIYPLLIGFTAAVFEEGVFRLFGIPFLIRFVKKPWIAVVITAFVWGFLHSNYPQSPWFARGIEVGLEGLLLGFLFLRFGILASVVSHYTFNALITSVALATSATIVNSTISFFFALLPLVVGIIFLIRAMLKKGFITQVDQLTNQYLETNLKKITDHTSNAKEQVVRIYQKLASKKFVIITILLAVVSVVAIVWLAPEIAVGTQTQAITRSDALAFSQKALESKNISTEGYTSVVSYVSSPPDSLEQEYLLAHADFKIIQELYAKKLQTDFWTVRYFKPFQKEEFMVYLLPTGKLYTIDRVLSETANGVNLSESQARDIANHYLQKEQQKDISAYELVSSEIEKRKNRTDYYFSFEDTRTKIKDATLRVDIEILGQEPSGFQEYIQLPETWIREKQKMTEYDFLFTVLFLIPLLALLVYGVITFFHLVKNKKIMYRQALIFSGPFIIISLFQLGNQLPLFYSSYPTSIPLGTYMIETVLGMTVAQIVSLLFVSTLLSMSLALWRKSIGPLLPENTMERWQYIKDALFVGYTFPFLLAGYGIIIAYISSKYKLLPVIIFPEPLAGLDTFLPLITVVDNLATALLAIFALLILVFLIYKRVHSPIKVAGIILTFLLLSEMKTMITSSPDITIITLQLLLTVISFILFAFVIIRVIKTNIAAYAVMLYTSIIFTNAWDLVSQEHLFYQLNGYILLFLGVLPIILYGWFKSRKV